MYRQDMATLENTGSTTLSTKVWQGAGCERKRRPGAACRSVCLAPASDRCFTVHFAEQNVSAVCEWGIDKPGEELQCQKKARRAFRVRLFPVAIPESSFQKFHTLKNILVLSGRNVL